MIMSDSNETIRADREYVAQPSALATFVDAIGMSAQFAFTGLSPLLCEEIEVPKQDEPTGCVKAESAGMLGLINCEFDAVTGVKLSTTRTVDVKPYTDGSGEAMGPLIDIEVECPRFDVFKCGPCPNRSRSIDQSSQLAPTELADLEAFYSSHRML